MKTNDITIKSTIDIHLLELARLRIGYINECDYSIDLHYNELKNFGETDFRLSLVSVWKQVPYFSEKERAIFALTDCIFSSKDNNELDSVLTLLEAHFTEEQICALTQAIKQINLWTRSMKQIDSISNCKENPES